MVSVRLVQRAVRNEAKVVRSLVTDAMVEEKEYKSGEGSASVDHRKDGTWA